MAQTEARSYVRSTEELATQRSHDCGVARRDGRAIPDNSPSYSASRAPAGAGRSSRTRSRPSPPGCRSSAFAKAIASGSGQPNRVEWLVTQFATAQLGLILVNINPAYRLAELEYTLGVSGCRAVVSAQEMKTSKYLEMLQTVRPQLPRLEWIIRMGEGRTPNMLNYADLLAKGRGGTIREEPLDCRKPDQHPVHKSEPPARRRARHSHRNILNNGNFVGGRPELRGRDRVCIPYPFTTASEWSWATLGCQPTARRWSIPSEGFDPASRR